MDVKKRISTLRMTDKAKRHPAFARQIGMKCSGIKIEQGGCENDNEGNTTVREPRKRDIGNR